MAVNIVWSLTSKDTAGSQPASEPHEMAHDGGTSAPNGEIFDELVLYLRHNGAEVISNAGFYLTPFSSGQQVGQFQTPAENLAEFIDWGNAGKDDGTVPVDGPDYGGIYLGMVGDAGTAYDMAWRVHKTDQGNSVDSPIPLSPLAIAPTNDSPKFDVISYPTSSKVKIAEDVTATNTSYVPEIQPSLSFAVNNPAPIDDFTFRAGTAQTDQMAKGDLIFILGQLRQVISITDVGSGNSNVAVFPGEVGGYPDATTFEVLKDMIILKDSTGNTLDLQYMITDISFSGGTELEVYDFVNDSAIPFAGPPALATDNIQIARNGVIESGGEAKVAVIIAVPQVEDQGGSRYVDHVLKFTATS